ncbi:hypothetical protein ONS95_007215 [Cadophora gregata]|uniref:uncharacterized protein n=1 Tax=Cadophora gregata TaxID=51156 RepID=UPI0026DC6FE5|nr:uncharacterized protein ONS95_007215 [Cadophora gregata]KAK0100766.1 hypothetical protein ONS95_007215 [Cadophora gregata]
MAYQFTNPYYDWEPHSETRFVPPIASTQWGAQPSQPSMSPEHHIAVAAEGQFEEHRISENFNPINSSNGEPGMPHPQHCTPGTGIEHRRSSSTLCNLPECEPSTPSIQAQANYMTPQADMAPNFESGSDSPQVPADGGNINIWSGLEIFYPFLIESVLSLQGYVNPHRVVRLGKDSFGKYGTVRRHSASPEMKIIQLKFTSTWEDVKEALSGLHIEKDRETFSQSAEIYALRPLVLCVMWHDIEGKTGRTHLTCGDDVELLKTLDLIKARGFKDHFQMIFIPG